MTREETLRYMIQWQQKLKDGGFPIDSDRIQALRVAIEALTYQNLSKPNNTCEVDLISRADAICEVLVNDGIENIVGRINALPSAETTGALDDAIAKYVADGLMELPSADRPSGEWIEKNSHTYICGECHFEQAIYGNIDEYNYCPRCGSYMTEVDYGGILPQKKSQNYGRPTGEWLDSGIGGAKVCSVCNAHMGLSSFNYCPNCGARMEDTK